MVGKQDVSPLNPTFQLGVKSQHDGRRRLDACQRQGQSTSEPDIVVSGMPCYLVREANLATRAVSMSTDFSKLGTGMNSRTEWKL